VSEVQPPVSEVQPPNVCRSGAPAFDHAMASAGLEASGAARNFRTTAEILPCDSYR